jgi:D-alanyl-D-alanine carboxypeptidase/D-alanyl-D-alanine-endopeptidase (penicillin-binding protein 4)
VAGLGRDLRAALASTGARYSVLVVSLDRGDTLFAHQADEALAPASNLKLFSTAAALWYLGPGFRWSTYALARGDVRDGVLEGDLVLYGTGDPTLDSWRLPGAADGLDALADSVRARGVREVRGSVVGDGTFFDARLAGQGWEWDDLRYWYAAPVAGLMSRESVTAPGGRPVAQPVRTAAERFHAALQRRGVRVAGGVRTVQDPFATTASFHRAGAPPRGTHGRLLAVRRSPPLAEVVRETNHVSHNLYADALLKTVGRVVQGEGSFAGGERAVWRMPVRDPAAVRAVRMYDGSGLSRLDRQSAGATVALLEMMDRSPHAAAFRASLPAAGRPEGLERRMVGTPAAGNLRAKTGTIRGVSSLSGYVTSADGERLAFSIIANGVGVTARAKEAENRIGVLLARFTRR